MLAVQEAPAGGSVGGSACESSGDGEPDWHLHVEVIPPHRSAERLKVRASVETALGQFINDTLPERSAAALQAVTLGGAKSGAESGVDVMGDWSDVTVPEIVVG